MDGKLALVNKATETALANAAALRQRAYETDVKHQIAVFTQKLHAAQEKSESLLKDKMRQSFDKAKTEVFAARIAAKEGKKRARE